MALSISCPVCGETEKLTGVPAGGPGRYHLWELRPGVGPSHHPSLSQVRWRGSPTDSLAIVKKSRGTQLSVVGIRIVNLCEVCDADDIARWQANRPNPLLPRELPTVDPVD